ncbi:MAG: arsenosugar biosynthesis radical SAM protein ArsS [Rubripirellula sp.]|nr:arsenosugar biosynthesis radical SAM protein ArsS [Rubripirellula sp.]
MTSLLPVIDAGLPEGIVEPFSKKVQQFGGPLLRDRMTDVQINLGKLCNQTCTHCHVDAGPTRKRENMNRATAERVMELVLGCESVETVDLTGGAPELNPNFRDMVQQFRSSGKGVIDRCNLTILSEPGQESLAEFLADQQVAVVASLPCYLEDNVDSQRGNGVFQRSIAGLQRLNELGYGVSEGRLRLDLVFNPTGPSLPPDQVALQADYKRELQSRYDIQFDRLLTITNIPIRRYAGYLRKRGQLEQYMNLLEQNFNPQALGGVMCRSMLSIGWDGQIYDCDFNQMLDAPVCGAAGNVNSESGAADVWKIERLDSFLGQRIRTADHCYGCTAGAGSSCGGIVVTD